MKIFQEPLFEPIARKWRFDKGFAQIDRSISNPTLADLGCGPDMRFYRYARKLGLHFGQYIGIDPLLPDRLIHSKIDKNVRLIKNPLEKTIPLPENSCDYVVGFAFLEHISYPEKIIKDTIRVLKKNGKGIFTTPSPLSKMLLEPLAKIGLISRREIDEHKRYFFSEDLVGLIDPAVKRRVSFYHSYFHPWMNNLLVIRKMR